MLPLTHRRLAGKQGMRLSVSLATLAVCACVLAADRDTATVDVSVDRVTFTVESARPVAKAVQTLVERYGQLITYEDPRYAFQEDLEDYTVRVRRDLSRYPSGKAPRVIGPRGGELTVSSSSTDAEAILPQLLQAQAASARGGRFRLERTDKFFHVVPAEIRDRNGNWAAQASVLDVSISLPDQERADYEMVAAICRAVSAAAHIKVAPGHIGLGVGIETEAGPQRYRLRADSEPARAVLVRALEAIAPQRGRLTWLLFYGDEATDNSYALNIMPVPAQAVSAVIK